MAGKPATVRVLGLAAFARDLKRAEVAPEVLAALREAGRKAADPVATAVRTAYPRGDTGNLQGSVRVTATRTGSAVRVGYAGRVVYAGPVDFGGWPEGRDFMSEGRYLYPTARNTGMETKAAETYSAALGPAFEGFGWTNKTTDAGAVHD